jgi:hypothetical protein
LKYEGQKFKIMPIRVDCFQRFFVSFGAPKEKVKSDKNP